MSTPIPALLAKTGIEPIKTRNKKAAIRLYERLKRIDDPYLINYKPASMSLKPLKQKDEEWVQELVGLDGGREPLPQGTRLFNGEPTYYCLTLISLWVKKYISDIELKAVSLETINER